MRKNYKTLALTGALTFILTTQADAAGFYIQEQSVSGLGAAFAGQTAMPRDASTVYFNPAGMTYLEGAHGNVGAHILAPKSDLSDRGSDAPGPLPNGDESDNPYDVEVVPNLHFTQQLNDRLWAGISVTAPFGLANEYDEGWFGRFDSTKTELRTVNIQPSIAYKLNDKFSIGGGVDIQYVDALLERALTQGTEGISRLEGEGMGIGFNIGLMYDITEETRLGLHYRSTMNHNLDGRIQAIGTGADFSFGGNVDLDLPDMINFGIAHKLNDATTIMAGATHFGWSNYKDISTRLDSGATLSTIEQNYKDTWAFNLGIEHEFNNSWTGRAGVQYDQTPTQDGYRSTTTPDGDRIWASVGGTYKFDDKWSLDLAATYIDIADEEISLTRNGGAATIEAGTSGHVGIFAIGVNYKF